LDLIEEEFWIGVPKARERTPESCGVKKNCWWKLFHREERPTLERNIIDTSERARANYRYLNGQHFGLVKIYE
jgi:hypothetical protein